MKLIPLIIGLIITGSISGQEPKKYNFHIDIGINSSLPYERKHEQWPEFEDHPVTTYKSNSGFTSSAEIVYHLTDRLFIQTGINYSYTRLDKCFSAGLTDEQGTIYSSNFFFSIHFGYKLSETFPLSVSAGPYIGFPISIKEKGTRYIDTAGFIIPGGDPQLDPVIAAIEPISSYSEDIINYFNKYDLGMSLEIEYRISLDIDISPVLFSRFNYGLYNVFIEEIPRKWKNYTFLIGIGVLL